MASVLYLHGVGDDGTRLDWWEDLVAGAPALDRLTVVAPDYSDLLSADPADLPDLPTVALTDADPTDAPSRRRYRAAQAALNSSLLAAGSHAVWPYRRRGFSRIPNAIDAVGELLVMGFIFDEVGRYNNDDRRRRAILDRVLAVLPREEPLVVVGHSLGSLVALDLLMHLPQGVQISLLVTAASALARRRLPAAVAELPQAFPYERVDGWINVFNPRDAVTRGLPIGLRFPQAIDVTVPGRIGDHNLATCTADPGVARVISATLAGEAPTPPPVPRGGPAHLTRAQAMELATVQIAFHMEQLLAQDPTTSSDDLARFGVARRMAGERAALRSGGAHHDWERDHSDVLWHGVAEPDLPSVLVRVATANPFAPLAVPVAAPIDAAARRRVAVDIGMPPGWVDVAARSHTDAAAVFRPLRRRQAEPEPEVDDEDLAEESHILAAVQQTLEPSALADTIVRSRLTSGLGDIRPACTELLARALTASRLGSPDAGSEERTVLSRLMVVLGDHRARVAAQSGNHQRLLAELRRRTATVGHGLAWLAHRNLGLNPIR